MPKIDIKKEQKALYAPSAKACTLVDVPIMNFLMFDGTGDPNRSPQFQSGAEALYTLSYTLKFMLKKGAAGPDYAVMPLEGLWWAEDMTTFSVNERANWLWTLLIAQPAEVTADQVAAALSAAQKKKALPALAQVRFEPYHEGLSAQIMHIGPFAAEGPTIAQLHTFIDEQSYDRRGKHHEIYLSDPRRTAPEKMKTVIRQPVVSRSVRQ